MRRLGLDPDDAEDLVQEAWLRWLKTQPTRVEQWLKVVIHGLAVDQIRQPNCDSYPLDIVPSL